MKLSNLKLNYSQDRVPVYTGTLFVILAAVLWGITGLFVRFFDSIGLGTFQIAFFKMSFASFCMVTMCLIKDKSLFIVKKKDLWVFACSGIISLDFFSYCYFYTISRTTMSVAAVLLYVAPTIVMLISAVLFKEKINTKKVVACLIAFLGCFFVAGIIGNSMEIPIDAFLMGILSAIGYALYSIFGKIAVDKGYKTLTITTYTFIFAFIGLVPFLDMSQVVLAVSKTTPVKFVTMVILISITVSLLPYMLYTTGLRYISPSKASVIASLEPISATILGKIVYDEVPDLYAKIGIVLVLGAVCIINLDVEKTK